MQLVGATPEERYAQATDVLRRRAATWDAVAPEALLSAFLAFARRRPPLKVLSSAFAHVVQVMVHDCTIEQPYRQLPILLWRR